MQADYQKYLDELNAKKKEQKEKLQAEEVQKIKEEFEKPWPPRKIRKSIDGRR
jgi:ribosomal protein L29